MKIKNLYECIIGSHAYGTNIETSDIDIKGIYLQNFDMIFEHVPQIEHGKDDVRYELQRFLNLLSTANPTILEMLFVDEKFIKFKDKSLDLLFENKKLFLTKQCANSFLGYAVAQIKKARGLNKKMNWEKEKTIRKTPIDFCYIEFKNGSLPVSDYLKKEGLFQQFCGLQAINHMPNCYNLYYDYNNHYVMLEKQIIEGYNFKGICFEDSNDIRLSSIPKDLKPLGIMYYNKDAYTIHCKEYHSYQVWLKERNVTRYVNNQQIDAKNMMHCIRLIECAEEIANTGNLTVLRPDVDYLLDIRKGKVNLEHLLEYAENKLKIVEESFKKSNLPENVDKKLIIEIYKSIKNANL